MEALISFLLQNLQDLGTHFYNLRDGAESELRSLEQELETIKKALEDASLNENCDENSFKAWENRIRQAVYEAEDLIDDFATHEFSAAKRNRLITIRSRFDLAARLKDFRKTTIEKILIDAQNVPQGTSPEIRTSYQRIRHQREVEHLIDRTVVGFEDEILKLKTSLLSQDNTNRVEVISITGMAGLGKTTVAWKIFSDPEIEHDFPKRIWVTVSDECKPRSIYLSILREFSQEDFTSLADSELATKSKEYLGQIKFLLVADDVWTDGAWIHIQAAVPMTAGSGKVLITSRVLDVATKANTHEAPHKLRFLHDYESWKLLQMEVYGDEERWPSDSRTIGVDISQKCGGLPLAIVVIGGILKEKTEPPESRLEEWKNISQTTGECFMKGIEEGMKKIIALSYNKVPYSLRHCLLYFAVFPKDEKIDVWRLIRLWIAEGFINANHSSMEEVALRNLKELIARNLVIADKLNGRGELKTCYVHDMIREFCKMKASDYNFFRVISDDQRGVSIRDDLHRISIHTNGLKFLEERPKGPSTRAFLCFSKHEIDVPTTLFKSIIDAYPRLRILDVSLIKFQKFETSLTRLNHLRYISLGVGENFKSLPESIAEIWSLQTLIIITSLPTFEIKADIADFRRLRHLKSKATIVFTGKKKRDRTSLDNLQTLEQLSTDCCNDEVLSMTPNLQTLGVCGNIGYLAEASCFQHLITLRKLKMINLSYDRPMSDFFCTRSFPPNLKILCLSGTNFDWSYMHTLGFLRLESLKLKDNAFKGDEWNVSGIEFHRLEYLQIERCNLLMWTMENGSFPRLTSLFLKSCERLNAVPFGLARTLLLLKMGLVTRSATLSAQRIYEETVNSQRAAGPLRLEFAPGT